MTTDPSSYVPVNLTVLLQTLVEAVHEQVEERRPTGWFAVVPPALDNPDRPLSGDNEPVLDRELRMSGYLARIVEVDKFEPAQREADWVGAMLAERYARLGDFDAAVASLCGDLACAEPVGKPDPEDPNAMSWRVPGPGGHVRHYLARRAIDELLRGREEPVEGDPADLKIPWMYGFFVRTCHEAIADAAALEAETA